MLLAKLINRPRNGFKCAVVGCKTGSPKDLEEPYFNFQKKIPYVRWVEFVNRKNFVVTESSRICIDHFESTYLSLGKESST